MSNSHNNPPPDDWEKTRPNIDLPQTDEAGEADWDKTNYNNFAKQPSADEWGKTVMNIKPIDTAGAGDYGKTMHPGAASQPDADWAATRSNANINDTDFGPPPGQDEGYGKTTPYFRLPEAERARYEKLPPTSAERAAQAEQEKKEQGGVPGWVWVTGGGAIIFAFFLVVLGIVAVFFLWQETTFDAAVTGAPAGSDVLVDEVPWGVTNENGSIKLSNLEARRRNIKIVHPNYVCEPREVTPDQPTVVARCQEVAKKATDDCANIQLGEEDKAERCYRSALDGLRDPFTAEQLVSALNILIVNFSSNSFEVPSKRLAALQKGAGFIKKLHEREPSLVLEIGGHTDNVGPAGHNKTLSENRAEAVKKVLVGYGVNASALQTRGYGADKPKSDNSTELGKFYNRRIEYSIVKK